MAPRFRAQDEGQMTESPMTKDGEGIYVSSMTIGKPTAT